MIGQKGQKKDPDEIGKKNVRGILETRYSREFPSKTWKNGKR